MKEEKSFVRPLVVIAVFILVFSVVYLLGSFAFADFNISNWRESGRIIVAFFGAVCGLFASMYVNSQYD